MRIAIFGLGYVGSVSAACRAAAGPDVVGVDVDPHKLALIRDRRTGLARDAASRYAYSARRSGRLAV